MSSFALGKPTPFMPPLVLSTFPCRIPLQPASGVYFSSVNNVSIFSSVDLSVNRTASAGGGSDKKSGSMHVTQMLLQSKCGCGVWEV